MPDYADRLCPQPMTGHLLEVRKRWRRLEDHVCRMRGLRFSEEQVAAFKKNRQGCVVDRALAEQMEWEIGDRIPLEGTIYTSDLDLQLVGVFEAPGNTGALWFNWNYLDEEVEQSGTGFSPGAGSIYAKCKVSDEVAIMSEQIDAMFANSENATRTRTEAAFQRMFAEMLGDVQTYIRLISVAVVFALALVAATSMAMSLRERTTEVAVLKSCVLGTSVRIDMANIFRFLHAHESTFVI